jgi:hypothetical protein
MALGVVAAVVFTPGVGTAQSDPAGPVSAINGSVPPAIVERLHDASTMMDTTGADGIRHVAFQGVRRVGTRSPIHIHDFGGKTCVLSGTMTLFVEGQDLATFPAGACYYMPPDIPMSAANLGTEEAHIIDMFDLPAGAQTFTGLEPGWSVWPEAPSRPPAG